MTNVHYPVPPNQCVFNYGVLKSWREDFGATGFQRRQMSASANPGADELWCQQMLASLSLRRIAGRAAVGHREHIPYVQLQSVGGGFVGVWVQLSAGTIVNA